MLVTALMIVNVAMLLFSTFLIILTLRRRKRHKIILVMIRMSRMNPVMFIKANKKAQWIAMGMHQFGYVVTSGMSWEEEMILLDEYFDQQQITIQKQMTGTPGLPPRGSPRPSSRP